MENLNQIIEALAFAAGRIISSDEIRESLSAITGKKGPSDAEIAAAVKALNNSYEETGRAFRIFEWGGGLRMATVSEMAPYVQTLFLETLVKRFQHLDLHRQFRILLLKRAIQSFYKEIRFREIFEPGGKLVNLFVLRFYCWRLDLNLP